MAIDSQSKRVSTWMHPALGHLPVGDSTLDVRDRQISTWTYAALGGEVAVSQQAVINYESLKGIRQQATINYEIRGLTFVSSQAIINYEALRKIRQQAVINLEAPQRIRVLGVISYEGRGVVLRLQQIHEIDALFPDLVTIDVLM